MVQKTAELILKMINYLSYRRYLALRGTRAEVIAFILSRKPEYSILLGRSPYHEMWMPPQEGTKDHLEVFQDTLLRCMQVECGLDIPNNEIEFDKLFHLRSIKKLGILQLPPERQGERTVIDDAAGTIFEGITLKRKAYWKATIILEKQDDIIPKPDGKEIIAFRWFKFEDARQIIRETNHKEKAELLIEGLKQAEFDLRGGVLRK